MLVESKSLVKYDNPVLVSTSKDKKSPAKKVGWPPRPAGPGRGAGDGAEGERRAFSAPPPRRRAGLASRARNRLLRAGMSCNAAPPRRPGPPVRAGPRWLGAG